MWKMHTHTFAHRYTSMYVHTDMPSCSVWVAHQLLAWFCVFGRDEYAHVYVVCADVLLLLAFVPYTLCAQTTTHSNISKHTPYVHHAIPNRLRAFRTEICRADIFFGTFFPQYFPFSSRQIWRLCANRATTKCCHKVNVKNRKCFENQRACALLPHQPDWLAHISKATTNIGDYFEPVRFNNLGIHFMVFNEAIQHSRTHYVIVHIFFRVVFVQLFISLLSFPKIHLHFIPIEKSSCTEEKNFYLCNCSFSRWHRMCKIGKHNIKRFS